MRHHLLIAALVFSAGCGSVRSIAPEGSPCSFLVGDIALPGRTLGAWTTGKRNVTICSYGAEPERLGPTTWKGSQFAVIKRESGLEGVVVDVDASDTAVCEVKIPNVIVTELARPEGVPLVRHVVSMWGDTRSTFVYPGARFDAGDFTAAMQAVTDASTSTPDRIRQLYVLRDLGVNAPRHALREIGALEKQPWASGEAGDVLHQVIVELTLARDLPHRKG